MFNMTGSRAGRKRSPGTLPVRLDTNSTPALAPQAFRINVLNGGINGINGGRAISLNAYAYGGIYQYGYAPFSNGPNNTELFYVDYGGRIGGFQLTLSSAANVGYINSSGPYSINNDTYLLRDAANTWAMRNSTNAQTFKVYGTYGNSTTYTRASFSVSSTGVLTIATEADNGTNLLSATDITLAPGSNLVNIGASGASRIKAAAFEQTQGTLTSVTNSTAWDVRAKQSATLTLSENSTLSLATNQVAGTTYCLIVKQDATGGRTLNLTAYKWPGGTAPTLSTAANAVDILTFVSDGTNMYGVAQKAFA